MAGVPIQRVIRKELAESSSKKLLGTMAGGSPEESLGKNGVSFVPRDTGKIAEVSSQELLVENGQSFVAGSY